MGEVRVHALCGEACEGCYCELTPNHESPHLCSCLAWWTGDGSEYEVIHYGTKGLRIHNVWNWRWDGKKWVWVTDEECRERMAMISQSIGTTDQAFTIGKAPQGGA